MTKAATAGHNLGQETAAHKPNLKANEIIASNAIAELVQRVVLNKENPKAAVAATAVRLAELMRA
jgi:multiple sugar transport system substrate-binding protein